MKDLLPTLPESLCFSGSSRAVLSPEPVHIRWTGHSSAGTRWGGSSFGPACLTEIPPPLHVLIPGSRGDPGPPPPHVLWGEIPPPPHVLWTWESASWSTAPSKGFSKTQLATCESELTWTENPVEKQALWEIRFLWNALLSDYSTISVSSPNKPNLTSLNLKVPVLTIGVDITCFSWKSSSPGEWIPVPVTEITGLLQLLRARIYWSRLYRQSSATESCSALCKARHWIR